MSAYFSRSFSFCIGLSLFAGLLVFFVISSFFTVADPTAMDCSIILHAPSVSHPFGTDDLGRDVLSRVIHGAWISLVIGASTMFISGILGALLGSLAGYMKRLDAPLMRLTDILMSFPVLLMALVIMAALGPGVLNVIIALTLAYCPRTIRLVRSTVLGVQGSSYVEAARAVGASTWRILVRHILPSTLPSLSVQQAFIFAYAILGEAALSFVGIGIQPPAASLGNILGDARPLLQFAPWLVLFPGISIVLLVLSINLIGDGLQELVDPKRRIHRCCN